MRIKVFVFSALIATGFFLPGPATADGDPEKGMRVFKKCKACHSLTENRHKVGPALVGLIGRPAGSAKDANGKPYRYSPAMRKAGDDGIVWDKEKLDTYLADPKKLVPKNKMSFSGLKKAEDRANVIAYIQSQMK